MSIKYKDRTARARYRKKVEELRVELYPTDEDIKARIAERLQAGEGKATYIKRLIRFDIRLQKALANALKLPPLTMEQMPLDYYRGKETLYHGDIITDGKVFQDGYIINGIDLAEEANQAVMYGNKHATLEEYLTEKEGADGEK